MHRKDLGLAALIASLFLVISLWVLYAPATPSQTETAHEAGEEHAEGGDEHFKVYFGSKVRFSGVRCHPPPPLGPKSG